MNRVVEITLGILMGLALGTGLVLVMVRSIQNAEDPARMAFKWLISVPAFALSVASVFWVGVPGLFVLALCSVVLSFWWTPSIGEFLARPLTSLFDGGNAPPEPRPLYSVAQSKQKRGDYLDAIGEIEKQLARFPHDFEGHILLAQIQAEDLKDVAAAELIIQRLCSQSGHAPRNIAFAYYSMADWHLRIAHDRDSARRNFEAVLKRLPDTEFALGAAQRIAHLGSADMPLTAEERRKFTVPKGVHNLGLLKEQPSIKPAEKEPGLLASEYVNHLQQHPFDAEVREKLAAIYADHYGQLNLATDQLEQMMQYPNQPSKLVVRWLNLLADMQIRRGSDYETVRKTLQRIIDRDPRVAAAQSARKRMDLLKLELKANEKQRSVKLGEYEQNLGLKKGRGVPPS